MAWSPKTEDHVTNALLIFQQLASAKCVDLLNRNWALNKKYPVESHRHRGISSVVCLVKCHNYVSFEQFITGTL